MTKIFHLGTIDSEDPGSLGTWSPRSDEDNIVEVVDDEGMKQDPSTEDSSEEGGRKPVHDEDPLATASIERTLSTTESPEDISGWDYRRSLMCFALFLLIIAAISIAVVLATRNNDKPKTRSTEKAATKAFTTTSELYDAIDAYLADSSSTSDVSLTYGHPMRTWDVSQLSNFSSVFDVSRNSNVATFNENLDGWDVSNAVTMKRMFAGAAVFDQSLTSWNVSQVEDFSEMFRNAQTFNGDLSSWALEAATDLSFMFCDAKAFEGADLSTWRTSRVSKMTSMFERASSFKGDISTWTTGSVRDMSNLFAMSTSFNGDLSQWNVSNVQDMNSMFLGATSFDSDLSRWDTSSVLDMSSMFAMASSFTSDLSLWQVSMVSDMRSMFEDAVQFNSNLSAWNIATVRDFVAMFRGSTAFRQNLCAWGKKLIGGADTRTMFDGTACPIAAEPTNFATGPWCFECSD